MTDEAKRCVENCREWYQAFSNYGIGSERLVKDLLTTADLIESLCAELEQVKREKDEAWKVVESVSGQNEIMADVLGRIKREHDAAVEDLKGLCHVCVHKKTCTGPWCGDCDQYDGCESPCRTCATDENWQWRGVNEDRGAPTCQ